MVSEVSPRELAKLLEERSPRLVLLDVREDEERATARIEPSLHIPMNDVPSRLAEIPRDAKLVIYCHHGSRSLMVAGYLEGEGFDDVTNLSGGIDAWSVRVDPKVARYD